MLGSILDNLTQTTWTTLPFSVVVVDVDETWSSAMPLSDDLLLSLYQTLRPEGQAVIGKLRHKGDLPGFGVSKPSSDRSTDVACE